MSASEGERVVNASDYSTPSTLPLDQIERLMINLEVKRSFISVLVFLAKLQIYPSEFKLSTYMFD